jgi:hypothetical protein
MSQASFSEEQLEVLAALSKACLGGFATMVNHRKYGDSLRAKKRKEPREHIPDRVNAKDL